MVAPLATYLHDHLAGASYAIDLIKFVQQQETSEALREFAAEILVEIHADRDSLERIAEGVNAGKSHLKDASAWLAEKISRMKFSRASSGDFGTFEALEFLTLGILGKRGLWKVLAAQAATDQRLRGFDFDQLIARAESQYERAEKQRMQAARRGLATTS